MNLLGDPDKKLKFIHIAGTAGKGSVATLTQQILVKNGYKTGLFTSPHVTTSIEKIKVNEKYIDPMAFIDIVERTKPLIDKAFSEGPFGGITYFEIFFCLALKYFEEQKCEWAVLEAGLGGSYDATNAIEKCEVAIITNIGYDHTNILGKTLSEIAVDKAGIIKPGCVFVTTERRAHLLKIMRVIAKKNKAIRFISLDDSDQYQEQNRALATRIAMEIGISNPILPERLGLPCRFEIIQKKPLVILDGAHNGSKMRSVVHNLSKLKYRKLIAIISIAEDKDKNAILREIIPLIDKAFFTRFLVMNRRCSSPKEINRVAKTINPDIKSEIILDPWTALESAMHTAHPNDIILVTGSFYLAGELRKKWHSEDYILRNRSSF